VGSGFRTFTAGEVLTASNVQNYLMDQSVMVFGGSAARSSAIGTANFEEGMVSYLTDTDKVEAYNGTNWVSVAPTTSQGLTLINTTSFSGVSSFSFPNDSFTSTYDNYRMLILTDASASPGTLLWRGRIAGVDTSTGNYDRQSSSVSNTTYAGLRAAGQTSGLLGDIFSAGKNSISMDIFSPKLTTTTLVRSLNLNSDFGVRLIDCGSYYQLNTSFDSISVIISTGTITGKASLYGYNL
jgi:hypothetical protein